MEWHSSTVPPRNRRRQPPRTALERLVTRPPPRVRDRAFDGDGPTTAPADGLGAPSPRSDTVDVACWTPVGDDSAAPSDLRTTLLADPSLPGAADAPVAHTLVLEVDVPTRSVAIDYGGLDTAVLPERGVRVRTDDADTVAVAEAHVTDDGRFHVTLAESRTNGALFVEYAVSRNPSGGNHAVDVVVDGVRETEARLVVMG
jgi:hypothetical protein